MGVKVMSGYSRTSRVRLPEDVVDLDTSTPIGAAAAGAITRILNRSTNMEDIGNVMTVAGSIRTTDHTASAKVTVGVKEYTTLVDVNGMTTKTADVNKVAVLLENGWKVDKIEEVEVKG